MSLERAFIAILGFGADQGMRAPTMIRHMGGVELLAINNSVQMLAAIPAQREAGLFALRIFEKGAEVFAVFAGAAADPFEHELGLI